MHTTLKTLPVLVALVFFSSCTKKDHDDVMPTCIFTGKELVEESSGTTYSKFTSTIELDTENPEMPDEMAKIMVDERSEGIDNLIDRKTQDIHKYSFKYDSNGFLTTLTVHKSFVFSGIKSGYLYGNRAYNNFKRDEVTMYKYSYQADLALSVSIKTVTTEQPGNLPPVVSQFEQRKVYKYDGNGKAISALTSSSAGEIRNTFKNGVIATSISTNNNGVVLSDTRYNELGLPSSISSNNSFYEMKYDEKGNLMSVKTSSNGKLLFMYELSYDGFENPENRIKKIFKGIPEPILTVQSTDGVNNTISERAIDDQMQLIREDKTAYQYNEAGLPVSAVKTWVGDISGQKRITTFRYNCL